MEKNCYTYIFPKLESLVFFTIFLEVYSHHHNFRTASLYEESIHILATVLLSLQSLA